MRTLIVALVVAIMSVGVLSAPASASACGDVKNADKSAAQAKRAADMVPVRAAWTDARAAYKKATSDARIARATAIQAWAAADHQDPVAKAALRKARADYRAATKAARDARKAAGATYKAAKKAVDDAYRTRVAEIMLAYETCRAAE